MTDDEFQVLDELYFVQSFDQLVEQTGRVASELILILENLYKQGWIKVMGNVDEELSAEEVDLQNRAKDYFYLATKKGLLAHNS